MKRSLLFVIALLLPMLGMAQKGLPNIEVTDLEGNAFNIQSVMEDGVPVVISFWYTTCKPCLQELGAINDVYSDWQDEAEFKFVAVSTDDSRSSSKVAPMVNGRGWNDFLFLLDVNGVH